MLKIDDRDISKLDLKQLRSEISVVLQNPFVVPTDTVRENLDPRSLCSDRELELALRNAAIHQVGENQEEDSKQES